MDRIITKPHHMVDIITMIGKGIEKVEPMLEYGHDQHVVFSRVF